MTKNRLLIILHSAARFLYQEGNLDLQTSF